jgi:hypothetical protein
MDSPRYFYRRLEAWDADVKPGGKVFDLPLVIINTGFDNNDKSTALSPSPLGSACSGN